MLGLQYVYVVRGQEENMQPSNDVVLRVEGLCLRFGGARALDEIGFEVRDGEIFAIIGPKGAGKPCVLNCINGFYRADRGNIHYEGRCIPGLRPS